MHETMIKSKVAITKTALNKEAKEATDMLKGKVVSRIWRHRPTEIGIAFVDGARLFVDMDEEGLELSITAK
jgi:hypothetical protein